MRLPAWTQLCHLDSTCVLAPPGDQATRGMLRGARALSKRVLSSADGHAVDETPMPSGRFPTVAPSPIEARRF
jgi:hypothetical protein